MGFSQEWEASYFNSTHMSIWPWSDLVSYVMRYAKPTGPDFTVLELGCGAGANIPLFVHLGVQYYAIEGSATIVKRLKEKFPQIKDNIVAGDFTKELPFVHQFDLIVDRGSLTHNLTNDISNALTLVRNRLKKDGKFIGIDWFSTEHSDYKHGKDTEDKYTKTNFSQGQFVGVGRVHFSDCQHLKQLFDGFVFETMEHKTVKKEIPQVNHTFATWNFLVRKVGG